MKTTKYAAFEPPQEILRHNFQNNGAEKMIYELWREK